ncbi:MAG: SMP-30/gluconolactonase/LRE family protein [Gammaproteobacteria bacterium]
MSIEFEIFADNLLFPEGPVALPGGDTLVVEIARGTLTLVEANGDKQIIADLGGGPNGAAIGPDGYCYVCNNGGVEWGHQDGLLCPGSISSNYSGGRIERVDLNTGKSETLYTEASGIGLRGPNDIVFDDDGGFWFTDTGKAHEPMVERGAIYYATIDGKSIERVLFPYDLPNGIALSPDGQTLYFSETLSARIWHFELSAPGKLAGSPRPLNPQNLLYGAPGLCGFDSMCIEESGNVCQATLFSGGVTVIKPDGELLEFVALPDPFVTNICFANDDTHCAYATLSGTGKLAKLNWPRAGLAPLYAR